MPDKWDYFDKIEYVDYTFIFMFLFIGVSIRSFEFLGRKQSCGK